MGTIANEYHRIVVLSQYIGPSITVTASESDLLRLCRSPRSAKHFWPHGQTQSLLLGGSSGEVYIHFVDHPKTFVATIVGATVVAVWGLTNARTRYLMHGSYELVDSKYEPAIYDA